MMTLSRLGIAAVAAGLLLVGCGLETGSGTLVTEVRNFSSFDRISASDGVRVEITVVADAEPGVTVRYDDNIIDNLVTRLDGSTLVIEFVGNVNVAGGNRAVEVVMPELVGIDASGGASVKATGRVAAYTIEASGGAVVSAGELEAVDVDVDASGGATVRVQASSSVTGEASGGASVKVRGNPPSVRVNTSGGATVDA
ncbi:MAG: hypothetical protein HKN91_07055 [Acidimicrobiia bacterium]|nr:hypothetical protein [Acidimicrobiia bacterium]